MIINTTNNCEIRQGYSTTWTCLNIVRPMDAPKPKTNAKVTGHTFARELIAEFPELAAEIEDRAEADEEYLPAGELRMFTEKAIGDGNFDLVRRCFEFVDRVYMDCDYDTWNEITVSYLEDLDLSHPNGKRARDLLPESLVRGWQELDDYLTELLGNLWRKDKKRRGWNGLTSRCT